MNSDHEYIENFMKEIFCNVNNWLTYAEAKNAALIAFDVAIIASIGSIDIFKNYIILFCLILAGTIVSLGISLLSFVPMIGKENGNTGVYDGQDNLIFYSDIAKYDKVSYVKALYKRYRDKEINTAEIRKIELDYGQEITYNAVIVNRKYRLFRVSLNINFVMIIILLVLVIAA